MNLRRSLVLLGDGGLSYDRPVGGRVLRRVEAALEPPSRVGIAGLGATRRVGDRGAQTHLSPNPYQALGLGGRSRPRLRGQCATGDRAAQPQDVVAQADGRAPQCASPEARSAHRTPMSFARSGTAPSRSAAWRPTPIPASCTSSGVAAVFRPHSVERQNRFQDETELPGSNDGGQAEVSPRLVGPAGGTIPRQALRGRRRSRFKGSVEPLATPTAPTGFRRTRSSTPSMWPVPGIDAAGLIPCRSGKSSANTIPLLRVRPVEA